MFFLHNWWLISLRGVSSVIFSIYFFLYPELTLELLVRGFCFYAFADGAFCILAALLTAKNKWWQAIFFAIGLLGIAAGTLTIYEPVVSAVFLLLSVGPWMILTGILEIAAAFILEKEFKKIGWLKIAGMISLIIGTLLLAQPFIGFLSVAFLIGSFQLIRGIINLLISFDIKYNRMELEAEMEEEPATAI